MPGAPPCFCLGAACTSHQRNAASEYRRLGCRPEPALCPFSCEAGFCSHLGRRSHCECCQARHRERGCVVPGYEFFQVLPLEPETREVVPLLSPWCQASWISWTNGHCAGCRVPGSDILGLATWCVSSPVGGQKPPSWWRCPHLLLPGSLGSVEGVLWPLGRAGSPVAGLGYVETRGRGGGLGAANRT